MKLKKGLMILSLFLFVSLYSLAAADQIGEIVYLDGVVELIRNGEILNSDEVDFGKLVENYDVIQTYEDGTITVSLTKGKTPGTEITISPNTVFSIELEKLKGTNKTSVNLLKGSIALKVQKITGNNDLTVNTVSAACGVRGTTFSVATSPAGEILVACEEGKVECSNEKGDRVYAVPGRAIESGSDKKLKEIVVAVSDLKKFKEDWLAEKIEVFKVDPLKAIKSYADRYQTHLDAFNKSYDSLVNKKDVLNKWYKEEKSGKIGSTMELMSEKKALIGDLLDIRKTLFIFEKVYYRLVELKSYHAQGYGKGFIKPGLTVDLFFNKFDRDAKDLAKKMAVVKHVIKLFALRNDNTFITDAFSDDEDSTGFKKDTKSLLKDEDF